MLDSGTLTLLKMGFGLAGDVLRLLNRRTPAQAAQVAPPAESGIGSLIDSSAARIQAAIADSATQIVDKIESDKLEELQSRVRNLAFLVKMGKTDQALHYAMTLRESVDYARNRLRENKMRWLGSWLAGQSVFLASLEYCGSCTEEVITEFQEEVQSARIELLDLLAPTLLSMDKGKPWLAIAAFAQGEDTQLFEKIPFGGAAPEASKAPRTPRTAKARPRQSAPDKTTALSADDILTVRLVNSLSARPLICSRTRRIDCSRGDSLGGEGTRMTGGGSARRESRRVQEPDEDGWSRGQRRGSGAERRPARRRRRGGGVRGAGRVARLAPRSHRGWDGRQAARGDTAVLLVDLAHRAHQKQLPRHGGLQGLWHHLGDGLRRGLPCLPGD